jgi:hypothetical protein
MDLSMNFGLNMKNVINRDPTKPSPMLGQFTFGVEDLFSKTEDVRKIAATEEQLEALIERRLQEGLGVTHRKALPRKVSGKTAAFRKLKAKKDITEELE